MIYDWSDIYSNWRGHCVKIASIILKNDTLAEDVVQDFFLKLLQSELHPGFVKNLPAFLNKSIYNQCIDLIRKRKNFCSLFSDLDEIAIDCSTEYTIQYRATRKYYDDAVRELPEKRRVVHLLQSRDGLREREIASLLGIALPTVKDHLSKSRQTLRESLIHLRA